MRIALDFDNTYTADPELWDRFIEDAIDRGHEVWIVTARRNTEENREIVVVPKCLVVIFTEGVSKIWHMDVKIGVTIDIWIDDDPRALVHGR